MNLYYENKISEDIRGIITRQIFGLKRSCVHTLELSSISQIMKKRVIDLVKEEFVKYKDILIKEIKDILYTLQKTKKER